MKKVIILVIIAFYTNYSSAQTHYEEWNKISITTKISKKVWGIVDFNLRQQSNYKASKTNIFQLPLMRSERLWLFYNLKNNYSIIGSFFYANTTDISNAKADFITANETQVDIGLFNKTMLQKTTLRSRLLLENRYINPDNASAVNQYRYRLQENATIPLKTFSNKNAINCVLNDEVFFKTQQTFTNFDQNRLYATLQWHSPKIEYNLGYQKTYQNQSSNLTERNQVLVNILLIL